MNTRKFPRSMREAFQDADYASAVERPKHRRMDWQDKLVIVGSVLAFLAWIHWGLS